MGKTKYKTHFIPTAAVGMLDYHLVFSGHCLMQWLWGSSQPIQTTFYSKSNNLKHEVLNLMFTVMNRSGVAEAALQIALL